MAENEDAFAIEARDQATLSRSQEVLAETRNDRPPTYFSAAGSQAENDEGSPLLLRKSSVTGAAAQDTSSTRPEAITKPWTGYESLPWYKRPSVRDFDSD